MWTRTNSHKHYAQGTLRYLKETLEKRESQSTYTVHMAPLEAQGGGALLTRDR